LVCPICQKRKAKRFCPAKATNICSVCCGTEREVTIDCPSDCPYLVASRQHDSARRETDWSNVPFSETRIESAFVVDHQNLLAALSYAICRYARDNRRLVDTDVVAALQALAEAYRTLSSGIYYEKPPAYALQRGLYDALKAALENFKKIEAQRVGATSLRDGEVRDALIFLTQLGATRSNKRPQGRAYLDFLRMQFKFEELAKPASNVVLLS
jgi:hypothetical protein